MCLISVATFAQTPQTQTSTTTETKTFEVIAVQGNTLDVKLPEGARELTVPDTFRFTVDGQQMSVHDLKPGMKGTANITTTTKVTPVTVTEVKNGQVVMQSGSNIWVRMPDGQVRMFTQDDINKRDVKIVRDGKPATVSDFRQGDNISATIVTSKPPRVVTDKEVQATLAKAAPPAAASPAPTPRAPAAQAAAPAQAAPPAQPAPEPAPQVARSLPKTAGSEPLVALIGLASLLLGATLMMRRQLQR
jgi:hypothetical protein